MKPIIFLSLVIFTLSSVAQTKPNVEKSDVPTAKETAAFKSYFQKSGLLLKKHQIESLHPGPAFKILHKACQDGDDLYILSFDDGIKLKTPKGEELALSYAVGTEGAWTPIFKHDPRTGYFHFVGASVHRYVLKSSNSNNDNSLCPPLEVGLNGSHCSEGGAQDCTGSLQFTAPQGYHLSYPVIKK